MKPKIQPRKVERKLRDPLSKSRITRWPSRIQNPYLADIVAYLRDSVFEKIKEGIENINHNGSDVEYMFVDDKPWYVVTPTETRIFGKEMRTSSPGKLVGGKMWLRLIIDGRETNFDLEVEWNELSMKINLDEQKLSMLAVTPMWKEEPKTSYLQAPDSSPIGGETEQQKPELQQTLENDIVGGLIALGMKKKEIDMPKVERVAIEWVAKSEGVAYNDLIGKAIQGFYKA